MKTLSVSNQIIFGILCLVCIVSFQNCGQGMGANSNNSASSTNTPTNNFSITAPRVVSTVHILNNNTQLNFSIANLPAGAVLSWSHKLNETQQCVLEAPAAANQYSINCFTSGVLAVSVFITAPGASTFAQSGFLVNYVPPPPTPPPGPTPIPVPTPIPTPEPPPDPTALADGRQLYATYCQNCHGPVEQSNERFTGSFGVNYAIQNNDGGMGGLSFLTSTQRADIGIALAN